MTDNVTPMGCSGPFRFGWFSLALVGILALPGPAPADSLADRVDLSHYSVQKDIPYGADPKQVFDLYIAQHTGERALPKVTIVFSHGGGYYLSDKSAEEHYIQPLLERGFDVVNINYRLGQGVFTATSDLAGLLRHLIGEDNQYGLASNRFVLMGFSAGGQMSANIGFWQNEPDDPFNTPKDADIAAIVNISGPSHDLAVVERIFLNHDHPLFRELGAALFPPHPRYTREEVIALIEPVNHFDPDDPPLFLWYGTEDQQIPPFTHQRLLDRIEAGSTKNRVIMEAEGKHSPSPAELARAMEELMRFLEDL